MSANPVPDTTECMADMSGAQPNKKCSGREVTGVCRVLWPGPVFCILLGVSSDYAQPITGQVTEITCPVIGGAQPELTLSKRQKTGLVIDNTCFKKRPNHLIAFALSEASTQIDYVLIRKTFS